MRHILHRPKHLTAIGGVLVLTSCAAIVYLTHYNLAAVLSVSVLLSSIPVALAFGLQSLLQGIIAGVVVRMERKCKLGRLTTVSGFTGIVESIGYRTTDLRMPDGSIITVPNTTIMTSPFVTAPPTKETA